MPAIAPHQLHVVRASSLSSASYVLMSLFWHVWLWQLFEQSFFAGPGCDVGALWFLVLALAMWWWVARWRVLGQAFIKRHVLVAYGGWRWQTHFVAVGFSTFSKWVQQRMEFIRLSRAPAAMSPWRARARAHDRLYRSDV